MQTAVENSQKVSKSMAQSIKVGEASTGSVWNKNSWHWEEKDYNRVSQQRLVQLLESIVIPTESGEEILLRDVSPSGFASISVRKGKKVVVFEYSIAFCFISPSGSGSVKIPEFSNDELEPILRIELNSGDERIKEVVRKKGARLITDALSKFVEFINTVETGEEIIESDKQRREMELEAAKQAEAAKGAEKLRIAEAVKAKEREQLANKEFVEASVWNPNSYHWETRKLNKWAEEWIKSQLESLSGFKNIVVSGEAENSIRKGKKISIYNLKFTGSFSGTPFTVPCFSNEEGDDELPKIVCDDSGVKSELNRVLKKVIFDNFLQHLKDQ
jgi:activator of HSP90 ATPase